MYRWIIFVHIAAALGFMLAHGVSTSVSFAMLRERNPERLRVLLEISASSYPLTYLSLLLLLLSGVVAGFTGRWWGHGWMWASLLLLVLIVVAMWALGGNIYNRARKAAGLPYMGRGKQQPPLPPASPEEVQAELARANPLLLTFIGFGGFLVILWLMMFKPF